MQTSKITVISQFVLLAAIFLLPVLFLPLNSFSLEPFKVFLILISGIVMSMVVLVQKIKANSFFVTKNLLCISVWAILISSLLSTLFSNNVLISLFGRQVNLSSFLSTILLFALSYAVASLFSDMKQKGRLFLTIHFSVLIVVALHLLNILVPFIPSLGFFVNNTINTVGKWYDLGLLSLFGLLSSVLVLQFLKHSKFYKILGWVGLAISAAMVILVNSILIWVLAGVFALAYIVLNALIQKDSDSQDQVSYPSLGILVLAIVFVLVGGKAGVFINQTFNFQFEEVRPTVSSTGAVIKGALGENPIFGVGVNRFETAWLEHRPTGVNGSNFWDTDFRYGYSNLLSIPVTHGILGSLAWLFFVVMSLVYALKLLFVRLEQRSDLFIHLYSVLGFVFLLIAMLVYVPSIVLIGLLFIFFGFFISNLNSTGLLKYKEITLDKSPKHSFAYVIVLVLLLIGLIYAGYIVVSQYSSRVIFDNASKIYTQTGDLIAAENQVLNAQFVYGSDVYIRSLTDIGLLKINALFQDTTLNQEQAVEQFRNTLQTTVGYANAAIEYDQQSYINRLALASIYKNLVPLQIPGSKEEALRVIDEIEPLTPNNPSLYLERARVYALNQEFDPASEQIQRALELKPNFVAAVFLLSQIQVEKGEIDQAIISIQSALGVQPLNPSLHFQLGLLKYNQQKYNEAIVSFENAVILSPFFGNAKYFLGLSYYLNGRAGDAITQFENLAEIYPGNTEVNFILDNLKAGNEPFDGVQPPLDDSPESRDTLPVDEEEPEVDDAATEEETEA